VRKKNILIVADYWKGTGVGNYLFTLIEYLLGRHIEVNLLIVQEQLDDRLRKHSVDNNYKIISIKPSQFVTKYLHKFPIGLFIEFLFLVPSVIKLHPHLLLVTPSNPIRWVGSFLIPKKIIYITHSIPDYDKKSLTRIRKALDFLVTKRKLLVSVSDYGKEIIKEGWLSEANHHLVKRIYNTPYFVKSKKLNTMLLAYLLDAAHIRSLTV